MARTASVSAVAKWAIAPDSRQSSRAAGMVFRYNVSVCARRALAKSTPKNEGFARLTFAARSNSGTARRRRVASGSRRHNAPARPASNSRSVASKRGQT